MANHALLCWSPFPLIERDILSGHVPYMKMVIPLVLRQICESQVEQIVTVQIEFIVFLQISHCLVLHRCTTIQCDRHHTVNLKDYSGKQEGKYIG